MPRSYLVTLPKLLLMAGLLTTSSSATAQADAGPPGAFFFESFAPGWTDRWHYSSVKKYKGVFETVQPEGYQDTAIQMSQGSVHYGLSTLLPEPLLPSDGIVVQFEVQFAQGHTCGGAYIKLLSQTEEGFKPKRLKSKTPFTIMFGPDRCGPDSRVHVILHSLNPVSQEMSEHHLLSAPGPVEDKLSHVYTLVLHKNNRFKVLIDGVAKVSGLLTTANFSPPLQPPETIPDPEHVKPEDWLEEEMMDDPSAAKPANWDDNRLIPDPHAAKPEGWLDGQHQRIPDPSVTKPADWDETKDGEWLQPTIPNPACATAPGCGPWSPPKIKNPSYKGPWIPPQVKNPNYKGPWKQRTIPNPIYFKADAPLSLLSPIIGVAFELWTTEPGYTFDSILLGKGEEGLDAAAAYMRNVWRPRYQVQYDAAMAAARQSSRPPGLRHWASNTLLDIFESRLLGPAAVPLKHVLGSIQRSPELGWAVLASPVLLAVVLVVARVLNAQKGELSQHEIEEQAADAEDKEWLEQLKQKRKAAKQAASATAAAAAATAAVNDVAVADEASTPAAAAVMHRRGQRQMQQQQTTAVGSAALETPEVQQQQQQQQQRRRRSGSQQQQDASPPSDDAGQPTASRSTRRTSRRA